MNANNNKQTATQNNTPKPSVWRWLAVGIVLMLCLVGLSVTTIIGWVLIAEQNVTSTVNQPPFTPLATPQSYNRIAYIDNDDNVWVTPPDGSLPRQLTSDGRNYRHLAWSPDNQHLAYVGEEETGRISHLFASNVNTGARTVLFVDPDVAPFYLYWVPDSQAITFLAEGEQQPLTLYRTSLRAPNETRALLNGSPLYWAWSPDGTTLFAHVGGDARGAYTAFLENRADATAYELAADPGRFQAPMWSADKRYVYYIKADGIRRGLLQKVDAYSLEETTITKLRGPARLALSPDGQTILYTEFLRRNTLPFGMAYLIDVNGENQRAVTDIPVASAYWSPDGEKIALLTLGTILEDDVQAHAGGLAAQPPRETVHRWWVYEVSTGNLELLKSFNPSTDFNQIISFYDQYHHSVTFWSPDSRYFLVTERNEQVRSDGQIWRIDTTFVEPETKIADGTFAVWSWR